MALKATIRAAIAAELIGSADLGENEFSLPFAADIPLLNGTGANQADRIFADKRTLAASASEDLDLSGVLTDPLGAVLTFGKVKAILVRADKANTNDVILGGASTNPFVGPFGGATHTVSVPPGGAALFVAPGAGWLVAAGSGDLLKIANSGAGTGVTYDIVIIGTSA
jgi:hypothetical protein